MKKIIVALCLPIMILSAGCKKFLDEKPYSFLTSLNFPTSEEEADIALRGIYSIMQGNDDADFRMFDYTLPVITSEACDNMTPYYIIPNLRKNESLYEGPYFSFFQGINFANNLISVLEKGDGLTGAWVEVKLAEAKAIRAYYYFWLVRMFSDVPLKLDPTTTGNYKGERTPVPEIYKQIVEDLKFAEDKLPNRADPDGRITKGGCKGILTQVYAAMAGSRRTPDGQNIAGDPANWALARDKAKEVLDLGVYTLAGDYAQIFKDLAMDIYNPEMIFDVSFSYDGGDDYGATFPYIFGPAAVGGAASMGGGKGSGLGVFREWVRELDPDDLRIEWNIAKYQYQAKSWTKLYYTDTTQWRVAKWRKWPDNDDSHQFYWGNYLYNWPLVRLADIKLLYAEAINETNNGPTAEAYQQVNDIRHRAGLADLPGGLTKEQFKDRIMNERSIEFLGEGMRHFDLVRWGNFKQMMDKRLEAIWVTNYGGVDESYMNAPVPQQELDINGWSQNK